MKYVGNLHRVLFLKSILIIDDDLSFTKALAHLLGQIGYQVSVAHSGPEGINRYRENPSDLVITDLVTQRHDGCQTVQKLKSEFPGFKFIALSGENVDTLPQARQLGARHTFVKPFATEELLETIEEELIAA